ncbi:hypothetical protein I546_0195 [Mycobacterium kansasii 732]|nr:hypothetical protein I546_0195 [Mycobacterium kansasii 732]
MRWCRLWRGFGDDAGGVERRGWVPVGAAGMAVAGEAMGARAWLGRG